MHPVFWLTLIKEEIQKLQRIEKCVYRAILGAPSYTQIPVLRGEIGSSGSAMETRITPN